MKFTEEKIELAIIELLEVEGYEHVLGQTIVREPNEVLIKEDIKAYLFRRYATDNITPGEVETVVAEEASTYNATHNIYKVVNQFEIVGYEKMARLTVQLSEQFAESARLEEQIKQNLAGLGYEF